MLLSHIPYNRFIKIIARNLNGSAYHRTTQWNHCNICGTASDIHNHIATWSWNINSSTNRRCNRFFYNHNLSGSSLISRIFYRLFFHFGNSAWHTNTNTWFTEAFFTKRLLYKIFNHFFCYCIIRNNTLTQRPYCNNISRRTPQHQSSFFTNRFYFIRIAVKC